MKSKSDGCLWGIVLLFGLVVCCYLAFFYIAQGQRNTAVKRLSEIRPPSVPVPAGTRALTAPETPGDWAASAASPTACALSSPMSTG